MTDLFHKVVLTGCPCYVGNIPTFSCSILGLIKIFTTIFPAATTFALLLMSQITGKKLPRVQGDIRDSAALGVRLANDITVCYNDPSSALLGWTVERSLDTMCIDTRRLHSQNPQRYKRA